MLSVNAIDRKFKIGAALLEDPAPTASIEEVSRMLSQQYPMIRHTTLYEEDGVPSADGKSLVYEYQLIPVKTQG